jgi:hypothetical protein
VPADYDAIRAGNIARYGTDTAVLALLGQLYSDRAQFLYELIQNAEDAGATWLDFALSADTLHVRHNGRPFTDSDVKAICAVGSSTKPGDLTAIGRFGIGFKAVYAYTSTPQIHSPAPGGEAIPGPGEHFRIEHYVRPAGIPAAGRAGETLFVFPFDRPDVPASTATAEISAGLTRLPARTLLFLRSIEQITIATPAGPVTLDRATEAQGPGRRLVQLRRLTGSASAAGPPESEDGPPESEDWLVWDRGVHLPEPAPAGPGAAPTGPGLTPGAPGGPAVRGGLGAASAGAAGGGPGSAGGPWVEIAVPLGHGPGGARASVLVAAPVVAFFATAKESFLGFLVQGPYRTTPARDNVPEHDPVNQYLAGETADLLPDVLAGLRDDGLLTARVLDALPLDEARFPPGSLLRGLHDSARDVLGGEALLPTAGGDWARGGELALTSDASLHALLAEVPAAVGPALLVSAAVSAEATPRLWGFLRRETSAELITPESFTVGLTAEFLAGQTHDWIAELYGFLYQHPELWEPARSAPIIRLAGGRQVPPFGEGGQAAVFLPAPGAVAGPGRDGLPLVHPAVAAVPAARRFLEALRLGAPDLVAEVLASVLPRYAADPGLTVDGLDEAQHLADVEQVAEALAAAAPAGRQELAEQLAGTEFLAGENAATGEQRLMTPGRLFLRTPGTEVYLAGNPDAWFARDRYGPWRAQLQELGVRDTIRARSRPPGPDGNVLVVMEFARNERGLHGFDPEASIEGLGFALEHPGHLRAEYIWNELLVPNRGLLAGTVERSTRLGFADSTREEVRSAIGAAAAAAAWLPGPDGAFHRPEELQLDDLPPAFKRDDQVAAALGMIAPVVAEASRQLGLPPGLLRGLAAHPDLVALVERELAAREAGPGAGHPAGAQGLAAGQPDSPADTPDLWALLRDPPDPDPRPGEPPGRAP